jgi:hypothetical protein
MRTLIIATSLILLTSSAFADQFVNGYVRRDGTFVQPHMRPSPDGNPFNNYSTRGNVNPYTGAPGAHNPYGSTYGAPSYPTYSPYGIR